MPRELTPEEEEYLGETRPGGLYAQQGPGGGQVGGGSSLLELSGVPARIWREGKNRKSNSSVISSYKMHTSSGKALRAPPRWMEMKDVAIDGTPLTRAERSEPNFWERKYRRELMIGEELVRRRSEADFEATHDIIGYFRRFRRWIGSEVPKPTGAEAIAAGVERVIREEDERDALINAAQERREQRRRQLAALRASAAAGAQGSPLVRRLSNSGAALGDVPTGEASVVAAALVGGDLAAQAASAAAATASRRPTISEAWETLMESVSTGRPLSRVAAERRARTDLFGIDQLLDSWVSCTVLVAKFGGIVGFFIGAARAMSVIRVDAQFLHASGIGIASMLTVTVATNVVKWAGNLGAFAFAFCLGDSMAKIGKRALALQPHEVERRGVSNYALGMAAACSTTGVLPWWVLNDTRFALRLAGTGAMFGLFVGASVGVVMERVIALNLQRVAATDRDLRRYEALLARERVWQRRQIELSKDYSKLLW